MSGNSLDNFMKQKQEHKKQFCDKFALSSKKPLLGIVLDKELSAKDELHLQQILEATTHVNVTVVILADTNLDAFFVAHSVILPYSQLNRKILMEAADMALGFEFSDVEEMLLNGTIPISPIRREVMDYNPNRETGNGFIYRRSDHWCMFAALVRALETFKFPYDWKNIVRQGMVSILL